MKLTDLNEDVLYTICSFLEYTRYIIPIIRTCKLLRNVARPHLLSNVQIYDTWRLRSLVALLQGNLNWARYIKQIQFGFEHQSISSDLASTCLDLMSMATQLQHLAICSNIGHMKGEEIKKVLCSLQHLQSLELLNGKDHHVRSDGVYIGRILDKMHSSLRKVVIGGEVIKPASGYLMDCLLSFCDTLEELTVKGTETHPFPIHTFSAAVWPRLRKLNLEGTRTLTESLERAFPMVNTLSVTWNKEHREDMFYDANRAYITDSAGSWFWLASVEKRDLSLLSL